MDSLDTRITRGEDRSSAPHARLPFGWVGRFRAGDLSAAPLAPAPQHPLIGPFLNRMYQGRMAFAGEHSCLAFFGYMEGALESGLRAALRVAHASHTVPAHHGAEFRKAAEAAGV